MFKSEEEWDKVLTRAVLEDRPCVSKITPSQDILGPISKTISKQLKNGSGNSHTESRDKLCERVKFKKNYKQRLQRDFWKLLQGLGFKSNSPKEGYADFPEMFSDRCKSHEFDSEMFT